MQFLGMAMLRFAWLPCAASTLCFPDSIAPSDRKNLVNTDGESYPVGFWRTSFDSYGQTSFASTALVQLVIEEILGYNTTVTGTGTWEVEGLYNLLGCTTPFDPDNHNCGDRSRTFTHVMVDAYLDPKEWAKTQVLPGAPVNLGSMGYEYFDGQFVSKSAFDSALNARAPPLNSYQGLSAHHQPWRHFDDIRRVNVSRLGSCSELFLNLSVMGDDATVQSSCPDGFFWLSPACRANASQCIPYFSPFAGWLDPMIAHKAIMWNIPLAIAGSKDLNDFEQLVKAHRCIFSWQRPSSLFASAQHIRFPSHEAGAYALRNYTTAEPIYAISKFVSHDLPILAPLLAELLKTVKIDAQMMGQLLWEHNRTNSSWRDVACNFLRVNPEFVRNLRHSFHDGEATSGEFIEFTAGLLTGALSGAVSLTPLGPGLLLAALMVVQR